VILALAPIARPVPELAGARLIPTAIALLTTLGVAMLVPGLYGEYYLHVAHGHVHGHADALNTTHLLTASGLLFSAAAAHLGLVNRLRRVS
jgi:hypothetical protein